MLLPFLFLFTLSLPVCAKDYFYVVEKNDQLGVILLSLGHKKLWPQFGMINLFRQKKSVKWQRHLRPGDKIPIPEEYILLKKNMFFDNDRIFFRKKLRDLSDLQKLQSEEIEAPSPITAAKLNLILLPGVGGFTASNNSMEGDSITNTFTGLQPIGQFKAIYSHRSFGSFSMDVLLKQIVNDQYSFPLNIDYRFQYVPKWNFTDSFRFAVSHSSLRHSYVGKMIDEDKAFQLQSQFIGIGVVVPRETWWFEFYFEKSYSGSVRGGLGNLNTDNGYRFDSELIYPVSEHWRIIPGINYFTFSDSGDYDFQVIETRLVLAREFDL